MKTIDALTAYYPSFQLGGKPQAIECQLRILQSDDGKKYLSTPFAMLNAYADDDHYRQLGRGCYANEQDCQNYLDYEYPRWETARPIMDALINSIRAHGTICGPSRVAEKCGCTVEDVYKLARGQRGQFKVYSRAKLFS